MNIQTFHRQESENQFINPRYCPMKKPQKQLFVSCDKLTFNYLSKKCQDKPVIITEGTDSIAILFWIIAQTCKYNTYGNDIVGRREGDGKLLRTNKLEADKSILLYKYPLMNDYCHARRRINFFNTVECLMFGVLVRHKILLELAGLLDKSDDFNHDYECFLMSYQLGPDDLPKDEAFNFYLKYRKRDIPQMSLVRRDEYQAQELVA